MHFARGDYVTLIVRMKRFVPLAVVVLLSGCGSKDALPYLGRWHGEFVVDEIKGKATAQDLKRESLKGSLQVYQTNTSFKLHLDGEQEAIDGDGVWSHVGTTVTLKFTGVKIDDGGGADHRDPNLKFIPAPDIQATYQRNMILHLSKDKKTLMGLEVTIGDLTGHHVFTRSNE